MQSCPQLLSNDNAITKKPTNTRVFFNEKSTMGKYCRVRENHWPILTAREKLSRDDREGSEESGFA
jgi:hypothetical protein